MAASVSMSPVAVPMYSCPMSLTRAGRASQVAKPKLRNTPTPKPSSQSAPFETAGTK